MPIYEYQCKNCSYLFDELHSIKEKPLVTCPSCGKDALARLIGTGSSIIFKGSGFYQTDYRSQAYKKQAKAEAGGGETKKEEGKKEEKKPAEVKKETTPATEKKPKAGGNNEKK